MPSLEGDRVKSHLWVKHNNFGDTLEFIIRDFSGAKIESWKVDSTDKKRQKQILKTIKMKHGIDLFFDFGEERDLSWLE